MGRFAALLLGVKCLREEPSYNWKVTRKRETVAYATAEGVVCGLKESRGDPDRTLRALYEDELPRVSLPEGRCLIAYHRLGATLDISPFLHSVVHRQHLFSEELHYDWP